MGYLDLILVGFAAWRVSNLLINEDGPFDVFAQLRWRLGIRPGLITGFFPKLFSCIWCMSLWTYPLMYALYSIWHLPILFLFGSAIVILIDAIIDAIRRSDNAIHYPN